MGTTPNPTASRAAGVCVTLKITWLVDNEPYFELTPNDVPAEEDWVFEQDMHFLLNVAVGGGRSANVKGARALASSVRRR